MAGKPAAASSAAITPLCDAKPTPNLLVNDGAAVLLPATVERQKAMPSALVQAENFAARGSGRERPKRDSARVNRLRIGREPKADAQIGAETNRGDQVFAGHVAHFFRRSQGRRDDRDARFIGDPVVINIELTAVAHGRVDQSGKGRGKLVSVD